MRRLLHIVGPLALGCAGGVAAVAVFTEPAAPPAAAAKVDAPRRARASARPRDADTASLRHRVDRVERAQARARDREAPAPALADEREPPPPALSREEGLAREKEEFDEHLRAHESSPIDPRWAADATASLTEEIEALGDQGGFELLTVDCRSASCTADVEWPSYDEARGGWTDILHGDFETNCARGMMLAEPDDPAMSYRTTVVFECDEAAG